MSQKGSAGVVVGPEGPTPAVVKSEEKGKVEVWTGGEGLTPAVVKSGEGDAVAGAPAPSPAPWLTARDKTSDLQKSCHRSCELCL